MYKSLILIKDDINNFTSLYSFTSHNDDEKWTINSANKWIDKHYLTVNQTISIHGYIEYRLFICDTLER